MKTRVPAACWLLLCTVRLLGAAEATSKLLPEPDATALKGAEAQVRSKFKEGFVAAQKDPQHKVSLVRRLLESGRTRTELPAHRFVCFRRAIDLAAQVGDLDLVLQAIGEITRSFAVDALKLRADAFEIVRRTPRDLAGWRSLRTAHLRALNEAVGSDRYELALAMTRSFKSLADSSDAPSLVSEAATVKKDVTQIQEEYIRTKRQRDILEGGSMDPATMLAVGKFLCLMKDDWKKGLPLLEKISGPLKEIGATESAPPASPRQQVALGDAWWRIAGAEKGPFAIRMQRRAVSWYEKALDRLEAPEDRARIENALDDYERALRAAGLSRTTYLSDLLEESSSCAHKFGKKGNLGYAALNNLALSRVAVNGKESPNGLSTHAIEGGTAYVHYALDAGYSRFETEAALVDGDGKAARTPLVFRVLGDDKVLWTSLPVQKPREVRPCTIRVSLTARSLRLEVSCPGDHHRAHSVWVEPRLTGEGFLSSLIPN